MAVRVIKARTAATVAQASRTINRVGAYCRVSTDSDDQESSYTAQCEHWKRYISSQPDMELVSIYADEGISGTGTTKRDQFNRMMEDCEAGKLDLILTKSISRWARNTLDTLRTIRRLKALGIAVFFQKENINTLDAKGEVLLTILASIAQQESQSISQNVRMGIQYRFAEGKPFINCNRFLGYDMVDGKLVINPDQAVIVQRIYREYLDGLSPEHIAARLRADGIPSAAGCTNWPVTTVRYILSNEKYCGDLLLQKTMVEDFLTHKCVKNNGVLPQYYVENNHDPIIPKEIFRLAQGEKLRRHHLKEQGIVLKYGSKNALSGRLICACCGSAYKRFKGANTNWKCANRICKPSVATLPTEERCMNRIVSEDAVKRAILKAFGRLHEERDNLIRLEERNTISTRAFQERIELLESQIEEIKEGYNSGTTGAETSPSDYTELEKQKDDAMVEMAKINAVNIQIHLLLEYIDKNPHRLTSRIFYKKTGDTPKQPENLETAFSNDWKASPCITAEEFFARTRPRIVKGFDDAQVLRYMESVTVEEKRYIVNFKAGVSIIVNEK